MRSAKNYVFFDTIMKSASFGEATLQGPPSSGQGVFYCRSLAIGRTTGSNCIWLTFIERALNRFILVEKIFAGEISLPASLQLLPTSTRTVRERELHDHGLVDGHGTHTLLLMLLLVHQPSVFVSRSHPLCLS